MALSIHSSADVEVASLSSSIASISPSQSQSKHVEMQSVDELPLEESKPKDLVDEGRKLSKGPIRPLQVKVAPAAASPPLWEIIAPPSSDGHGQSDIESQRHRMDTFGSQAESSKRLFPKSSYYYGPPSVDAAFGTKATGQIGVHHPREIVRIERDYSGGELIQFAPVYPLEFEGRISATRFLESINLMNEVLISAHSLSHSFLDNALAFFTLQISRIIKKPHYEKEMQRLKRLIEDLNTEIFNPVGLNVKWPRRVAFMFLEIEYY